jgi:hypothetical protein
VSTRSYRDIAIELIIRSIGVNALIATVNTKVTGFLTSTGTTM